MTIDAGILPASSPSIHGSTLLPRLQPGALPAATMLADTERHQPLGEWNPAPIERPQDRCIHELIEAQATRTPHAVAAATECDQVTYAALNDRANRLARRLREMGAGPDVLVGLFVERSLDMVAGLLAILKAGAAYVPLDPEYPDDHLAVIANDAGIAAIVTHTHLVSRVLRISRRPIALVSTDGTGTNAIEGNVIAMARPDDLAYVMYTSGSTGRPKGVMVTHRNVVHSTSARLAFYHERVETFLLLPSFAFDASVATIFWTLCTGGRLGLPPPGAERDPSLIGQLVERFRASHLLCVSSLYAHLLNRATPEQLASIRTVVVGGEQFPAALAASHHQKAPQARLFNEYGATECTVWSTVHEVHSRAAGPVVPIGRPIPNVQTYVLNEALQPVPADVAGELYIGGDGVARGYLHQPELTSARFIPHPFCRREGARLYKTGDLVRHRTDGLMEFVGRADYQAKVGGFRIEPEEVEAVLAQHPSVETAAVTAFGDPPSTGLAAYVVARPHAHQTGADLRAFLRSKLPGFMVPSSVVFLPALPTTATGKIDRRALLPPSGKPEQDVPLEPGAAVRESSESFEQQLQELWEQLLDVRPVGANDNFFELGGNSLVAVDLLTRMEALTGRQLRLASLIEAPTIRELTRLIRELPDVPLRSPLLAIQPRGSRPALFCVHPFGAVCSFAPLAKWLGPDQPVYALRADELDGNRPSNSIEDVATGCIREIRIAQPRGPYYLAGYSLGGLIAFEIARQFRAAGESIALLALFNTFNPAYSWLLSRLEHLFERGHYHQKRLSSEPDTLWYMAHGVWRVARRGLLRGRHSLSNLRQRGTLARTLHAAHDANRRIGIRYVPQPYVGRLTLFRATRTYHFFPRTTLLGWKQLVSDIEVHDIAGDHWTMLGGPHVQMLADQLRACLEQATPSNS